MNTAAVALRDVLRIVAEQASAMAAVQQRFTASPDHDKPQTGLGQHSGQQMADFASSVMARKPNSRPEADGGCTD